MSEFFVYAVNSVLWQRGVYPEDSFERKHEYDTVLQVTKDTKLRDYLSNVLGQVETWAAKGNLQQLVLVIASIETGETLERWVFNIETERNNSSNSNYNNGSDEVVRIEKPRKQLNAEIGAIMRQITSSVSFLPLLEDRCSFDLLVYTDKQAEVPITWENSDPRMIQNSQQVKLRGFNTNIHKVEASVAYKMEM